MQQGICLESRFRKPMRNVFQAGGTCHYDNLLTDFNTGDRKL